MEGRNPTYPHWEPPLSPPPLRPSRPPGLDPVLIALSERHSGVPRAFEAKANRPWSVLTQEEVKGSWVPRSQQSRASPPDDVSNSRKKQRRLIVFIILAVLVVIGAVLGGVLGSPVFSSGGDEETPDKKTSIPTSSASFNDPSTTGTSTNAWTKTASSEATETSPPPTIHQNSRVSTYITNAFPEIFRIIAYVDADGNLASSQLIGDEMVPVPIRAAYKLSHLPQPVPKSPLFTFALNQKPENIYLLYVDKDFYLCLISMSYTDGHGEANSWAGGRLETKDTDDSEPTQHRTTKELQMAAEIFPSRDSDPDMSDQRAERVNILFRAFDSADGLVMLSTFQPDYPTAWEVTKMKFKDDDDVVGVKNKGGGMAIMPTFKQKNWTGLRMVYDMIDDQGKNGFGVMKCKKDDKDGFDELWEDDGHWKDKNNQELFRKAPKPLNFQFLPLTDGEDDTQRFTLLILDGEGALRELYWDGGQWAEQQAFVSANNKTSNATHMFSSFTGTGEGILYGIEDGRMLGFRRLHAWWASDLDEGDAAWKLEGPLNTTMVDDQ